MLVTFLAKSAYTLDICQLSSLFGITLTFNTMSNASILIIMLAFSDTDVKFQLAFFDCSLWLGLIRLSIHECFHFMSPIAE